MARVASLGIHIVDVLGRPVSGFPSGQQLAILDEIRVTVAGTAAGTSVDLAKLGADVLAMGAIGADELGDFLVQTMHKYGIDTGGLKRKPGVQTSATMLPIRPNGERPALHVPGASREFCVTDVDFDRLETADFLHVGGTPLMPKLDGEPLSGVLKYAHARGITTTYDLLAVDVPELAELVAPCLPYVDFFMPGYEEALMICGLSERRDVIRFFLDRGARHVVFKMGAAGSIIGYYDQDGLEEIHVPAFRAEVVDSTGCGDAYCAGFIVGLSLGWDLRESARLGAAAGALVIEGLGSDAGIRTLEQTIAFMNSTPTISSGE